MLFELHYALYFKALNFLIYFQFKQKTKNKLQQLISFLFLFILQQINLLYTFQLSMNTFFFVTNVGIYIHI